MANGTHDLDPDLASDVEQPCCVRCGRTLNSSRSRHVNYGAECWTALLAAARELDGAGDWTTEQLGEALELLRDGGMVLWRQSHNLVYRSVATDGVAHYLTTSKACNCPAGRWERPCYHRLAVTILQYSTTLTRSRQRRARRSY